MSLQSDLQDLEFQKWLDEGNIPVYQSIAGKDMGKYKILGLRELCFETEQVAKQYYMDNNIFLVENMITEKEEYY